MYNYECSQHHASLKAWAHLTWHVAIKILCDIMFYLHWQLSETSVCYNNTINVIPATFWCFIVYSMRVAGASFCVKNRNTGYHTCMCVHYRNCRSSACQKHHRTRTGRSQFSSVQFKMESMRTKKPICAPPRLSYVSPALPLKQFQCLSDWRWPSLVLSRKIV